VLTRGQAPAAMAAPQIDLRPYIEVTGLYDTGLSGAVLSDQGQLANAAGSFRERHFATAYRKPFTRPAVAVLRRRAESS
jgi:hypothetical protein